MLLIYTHKKTTFTALFNVKKVVQFLSVYDNFRILLS